MFLSPPLRATKRLAMDPKVLLATFLVPLAALLAYPRASIPAHLLHHTAIHREGLIDPESGAKLNALLREMASDATGLPTNVAADLKTGVRNVLHQHIGEARPVQEDGTCAHPFLVPDLTRESCILPQRVDVGRHFVMTGGPEAIREPFDHMVSRVSSFGRYMFNLTQYPVMEALFAGSEFQAVARSVCPADKQVLDPFQFNFILQVPGQTVALHLDAPYFVGATRFEFPQWLLAVMAFSGLFKDRFVDQVQVVGYLHDWKEPNGTTPSGLFLYYDDGSATPKYVPATPLSGVAVDGSKSLHAAGVFRPNVKAPKMDKDKDNALFYIGDDRWEVRSDGEVLQQYSSSDLRMTIVYRARCFSSEGERSHYNNLQSSEKLSLADVLRVLTDDLAKRGILAAGRVERMDRLDLAILLMDTYIKYPLPSAGQAVVPLNYCALPRKAGQLKDFVTALLSPFCGWP